MRSLRLAGVVTLALSLWAPAAFAGDRTKVQDGPATVTPGVNNGQSGYWVTFTRYTYAYQPVIDQIKSVISSSGNLISLTDDQLNALAAQISNGQTTLAAVQAELQALQPYLTNIDLPLDGPDGVVNGNYDYHRRSFDLPALESAYGEQLTGQFGSNDGGGRRSSVISQESNPNADGFYHNTKSILSQCYRFYEIAKIFAAGPLTGANFTNALTGNFSQYAGTRWLNEYNGSNPYLQRFCTRSNLTVWSGWSSVFDLDVPGGSASDFAGLAQALYHEAIMTASPIALDLNHDAKIGVTGKSTARMRNPRNAFVAADSILFDLGATGRPGRTEWLDRSGDGFLVDDRQGIASRAARGNGMVDGRILFGNAGGYADGYVKLAALLDTPKLIANATGLMPKTPTDALEGRQLAGLKVWIDANHDGRIQPGELHGLPELGISAVSLAPLWVKNADDEWLMRGHATREGKDVMTEDVWFAQDPGRKN